MSKKNLFSDNYDFVTADTAVPSSSVLESAAESSAVQTTWVDKRTGAEYLLKDTKAAGPQGDFRVGCRRD
jgi:hypothetical protein